MSQHDLESTEQHSHPLGPLIYRTPVQQNAGFRAKAIMVLLAAGAIIGTAGFVTPDPKGYGTHEQLGQQRCSWPRQYAIPCPTCGMTTAFAYVVRGRMLSGFAAQPFGALLALATCLAAVAAIYTLVTGRSWRINFYRLQPRWLITGGLLLFGAAWAYKILVTRGQMG